MNGRVRFSDGESVLSFYQTTAVTRFVKVQRHKRRAPTKETGSTGQPGWDVIRANHDGSRDYSKDSVVVAHSADCAARQKT